MTLRTKSVWSKVSKKDGLRILVTRFDGRGLPKENRDVWMANLGPSETLLHELQQREISWGEFKRRYRKEFWADDHVDI